MEHKLLLIKTITLLYKEALIKDAASRSTELVRHVIDTVRIPETGSEFGTMRDRLIELRNTAKWMAESQDNGPFDRRAMLQRIRMAAGDDESVFIAFEIGIGESDVVTDDILKQCLFIRNELQEHLTSKEFMELVRTMYQRAAYGVGPNVSSREFIRECAVRMQELSKNDQRRIKGMVDEIHFENEESTIDIMTRAKEALSTDGALRFGQDAINDACYDNPGALRGEFWLVSALSHNYKSGFGLISFVDFALFNRPWMIDINKKPLLMHISTENSADQNAVMVYQMLKERETGVPCSSKDIDPVEAARYIRERLAVNGYHTYMCRVDPSDTTVFDLQELIEAKEAEGYEIHAVVLDYADMLDKRGLAQGPAGTEKRDLMRRLRNFFSKRRTFCMTFHQLGPLAQQLQRQGTPDLAKEVAGRGYYDGCTKLFQEVDVDITLHIERIGDESWLTMQWAKHRKAKRTPRERWYAAMRMTDVGGLLPDTDRQPGTPPNYVRDLKTLRQGAGNDGDWYSQAMAGAA